MQTRTQPSGTSFAFVLAFVQVRFALLNNKQNLLIATTKTLEMHKQHHVLTYYKDNFLCIYKLYYTCSA